MDRLNPAKLTSASTPLICLLGIIAVILILTTGNGRTRRSRKKHGGDGGELAIVCGCCAVICAVAATAVWGAQGWTLGGSGAWQILYFLAGAGLFLFCILGGGNS
jgi:phosphotransferase system  glucose/maltose/N-acetylglucosamine-specific IIC component